MAQKKIKRNPKNINGQRIHVNYNLNLPKLCKN